MTIGPHPFATPGPDRGVRPRLVQPSLAILDLLDAPAALVAIDAAGIETVRVNDRWRRVIGEDQAVVGGVGDAIVGAAIEAWERGLSVELEETAWIAGRPWSVTVVPWSDDSPTDPGAGATTVVVRLADRLDDGRESIHGLVESLASATTVIQGFAELTLMRLPDASPDEIEDHLRQVLLAGRSLTAIATRLAAVAEPK